MQDERSLAVDRSVRFDRVSLGETLKAPARSAAATRCGPQSLRSLRSLLRLALRKTLRVFRVLVRSAHENAERTAAEVWEVSKHLPGDIAGDKAKGEEANQR